MRQLPVTIDPVSPLLTPAETAHLLGVTARRLARMRRDGTAPTYYRISPAAYRYDRAATEHHPQYRPPAPTPPIAPDRAADTVHR